MSAWGYRVIVAVHRHVVVDMNASLFPFGIHVALGRQRLQFRFVQALEVLPARVQQLLERPLPQHSIQEMGLRLVPGCRSMINQFGVTNASDQQACYRTPDTLWRRYSDRKIFVFDYIAEFIESPISWIFTYAFLQHGSK
jgi:hypothetical protein